MKPKALRLIAALIGATALMWQAPLPAAAQSFPNRQITIVVPYAPAGILDVVARIVAEGLRIKFNQAVVVLNKVGGGGMIGIREVMRAAPDGYTLLMANDGSHAIYPFVDPNVQFDPLRDFVPIAMPAEYSHAFMINAKVPATTVKEFVAYAKSKGDSLSFGTPGYGSVGHVAMEYFMEQTSTRMLHVPYRGTAPALYDLMIGEITASLQSMSGVIPQIGNADLRILAVTGKDREAAMPDVPTMEESGFPGFIVTSWLGILAPADTPTDVQQTLGNAIVEVAKNPQTQKSLRTLGLEPATLDAPAFAKFYKAEIEKWKRLVAERGIKIPG
ncbi:MAG: extra-cytoplasmic solute receptor protein [Hyphomicrobiales bacterium]|nr:extra-cytoplasmic solute receptor protein [Hyphomicrobiales bacterium]